MRIIVGLGNPGTTYQRTRHNLGFMVVDELARRHGASSFRKKFKAEITDIQIGDQSVILCKPQTYMNLSGLSVVQVVNWYQAELSDLLIVHDDLDLDFGTLRFRAKGSAGGHNGVSSIIRELGTNEFARLKIGIGRGSTATRDYVLSGFSATEARNLPTIRDAATDAVQLWVTEGIVRGMNEVNNLQLLGR